MPRAGCRPSTQASEGRLRDRSEPLEAKKVAPSIADEQVEPYGTDRNPKNPVRIVDSCSLLGNERELRIRHNGEQYLLRLTRLGKLILTK